MTVQPTRDQLRALADAAMPAPWEAARDESDGQMVVFVDVEGSGGPVVCTDLDLTHDDAAFISAARTAIPQLLDQLDVAEQRIRDLTQEVQDERGAARDQMEQVSIRDARIRHLEDTARVLVKEALNAEAERDSARGYISELETAVQSRNDVIKHRDARIKAVEDVLDAVDGDYDSHGAHRLGVTRRIRRALDGDA